MDPHDMDEDELEVDAGMGGPAPTDPFLSFMYNVLVMNYIGVFSTREGFIKIEYRDFHYCTLITKAKSAENLYYLIIPREHVCNRVWDMGDHYRIATASPINVGNLMPRDPTPYLRVNHANFNGTHYHYRIMCSPGNLQRLYKTNMEAELEPNEGDINVQLTLIWPFLNMMNVEHTKRHDYFKYDLTNYDDE